MMTKEEKAEAVKQLKTLLPKYRTIALADLRNLPTSQLNRIRKKIREHVLIKSSKNTLLLRALEGNTLKEKVEGPSALVFSDLDAFRLFKLLKENRNPAYAKAGEIALEDIVVPAGETSLMPGPVLTELKKAGIKAAVKGPKITITQSAVVAKKGEKISAEVAKILQKLDIKPMKIGIKLKYVVEGSTIYLPEILDINEEEFKDKITKAAADAFALSIGAVIPTKQNITNLISKAFLCAKAVGVEGAILTEQTISNILAEAAGSAVYIKNLIDK